MSAEAQTLRHPGLSVPPAPTARIRSGVARMLFGHAVRRLPLRVELADGSAFSAGPHGAPTMRIQHPRFFHRLGAAGKIGFGEAYMAGDWTTDDLPAVLSAFAGNVSGLVPGPLQRLRRVYEPSLPSSERNTPQGAAANISRHYDLSNELFALFLDETMTYSCAVFERGDTLEQAQRRKYEALADMVGVEPGHHLLEIGAGWGGMAIHAATTRGCRVTTATISREQRDLARERIMASGLADRVEVVLCDYRDLAGSYDRIVSIEMFEAVGEEYWPTFFAACDRLLRPDGRMAMQTITMPHGRYLASRRSFGWIHKYIFPGGLIPSPEAIETAVTAASTLRIGHRVQIGSHYAATLRHWREAFSARAAQVRELGLTDEFIRMWEYYLAYCEAGFATAALGDEQILLTRAGR